MMLRGWRWTLLGLLALGWLSITGCEGGTSTETEAQIVATFTHPDGSRAVGARVYIRPVGYLSAPGLDTLKGASLTTNHLGLIRWVAKDTGLYNLEAALGDSLGLLIRDISPGVQPQFLQGVLDTVGSVRVKAPAPSPGTVYTLKVYGMERIAAPDSLGNFHLTLPAGDYRMVITSSSAGTPPLVIQRARVESGKETLIDSTRVNPPIDTAIVPPVDTTRVNPPIDTAVVPPKDTTQVNPPVDTAVVPPKDTTRVNPPIDTTVIPPIDTTRVNPPIDTTQVNPPVDTLGVPNLDSALIGYWPFEEGSPQPRKDGLGGHAIWDSSGSGLYVGHVFGADWVLGKVGLGLRFAGQGLVNIGRPDPDVFDFGAAADFSFSAWSKAKPDTTKGLVRDILAKVNPSGYSFSLRIFADGRPGFRANAGLDSMQHPAGSDPGVKDLIAPVNVADNAWHHLAGVRSKGRLILYVDGKEVAAAIADRIPMTYGYLVYEERSPFPTWDNEFIIGGGFSGDLDEVRVYGRSLTPREVRILAGTDPP